MRRLSTLILAAALLILGGLIRAGFCELADALSRPAPLCTTDQDCRECGDPCAINPTGPDYAGPEEEEVTEEVLHAA